MTSRSIPLKLCRRVRRDLGAAHHFKDAFLVCVACGAAVTQHVSWLVTSMTGSLERTFGKLAEFPIVTSGGVSCVRLLEALLKFS